ncbi:hypothetical protein BDR22DRAFT_854424, partial [Usnea florida]
MNARPSKPTQPNPDTTGRPPWQKFTSLTHRIHTRREKKQTIPLDAHISMNILSTLRTYKSRFSPPPLSLKQKTKKSEERSEAKPSGRYISFSD